MTHQLDLNDAIQVKTALKVLSPGMYTIRYQGTRPTGSQSGQAQHSANIPLALSQAPINMAGEIEFICPEGISHQTLSAPGDYLIAHVKRGDAVLAASKYSPKPLAGKVDVQWRIESLQQPVGRTSSAPAQANQHPEPYVGKAANSLPLTLTGHIERRGDVTVNSGEWLGDPNGTARLEGLQIESNALPQGVEILGACRAGNQTLQAKQNNYLGTKRQATAITQLALCLGGENANNYQLDAEAVFSDGSRHSLGKQEAVRAATGNGHLVAVRLCIHSANSTTTNSHTATNTAQSSWLDPQATYVAKA
ncbi:MAG: hypothetical protein VYB92_11255 [Pseudomonadota bacterium]|nr:hypothetical protein [Pseudomonadota bacterium]MEE3111269.1 hypothetical protein [Pseudomonadota bacterium]